MRSFLKVDHLNVAVEDRILIRDLSFQIKPGTLTCVTGENGAGKTTLMRTLLRGYHRNPAIHFRIPFQKVQYVPQFRNVDTEFPLEIQDFVGLSLQRYWFPWLTQQEKQRRHQVLAATHLLKIADEPLGEASGGEQQRVFLAQALVTDPQLLILDETTASLDTSGKVALLKTVMHEIKRRQVAVMFITHDPGLMRRFGDYELEIKHRKGIMHQLRGQK